MEQVFAGGEVLALAVAIAPVLPLVAAVLPEVPVANAPLAAAATAWCLLLPAKPLTERAHEQARACMRACRAHPSICDSSVWNASPYSPSEEPLQQNDRHKCATFPQQQVARGVIHRQNHSEVINGYHKH